MQRDLDLLRRLLLRVDAHPADARPIFAWPVEGYDEATVEAHVALLIDAGLIVGHYRSTPMGRVLQPYATRLTMAGHELVDALRNDVVWTHVRAEAAEADLTLTLELAQRLLAEHAYRVLPPAGAAPSGEGAAPAG